MAATELKDWDTQPHMEDQQKELISPEEYVAARNSQPDEDEFEGIALDGIRPTHSSVAITERLKQAMCGNKLRTALSVLGALLIITLVLVAVIVGTTTQKHTKTGTDNPDVSSSSAEERFVKSIDPSQIRDHLKHYSSSARLAGTPEDYSAALYTRDKWQEYGIPHVDIQTLSVLLSYPTSDRLVELVSPPEAAFTASLREAPESVDPTSSQPSNPPTFNGYSASGDVTAELVYANYGRTQDFAVLTAHGINCTGKIVIVRYGQIFRGNKVQLAAQHGAVGVLIYSDPADDGYARGPVYPHGPWRSNSSVQRGSVFVGDGDPLTPGWGSVPGAAALDVDTAYDQAAVEFTLPQVPVMPLSYSDAAPLLQALGGQVASDVGGATWQGALPFTYHTGPGPAVVHLRVSMNTTVVPIWNVIGRIDGAVERDRLVLLGNHRDSWSIGAGDAATGSSSLNEIARGLGRLLREGWAPRRTIMLCSWDAEEYGLVGSYEFVETFRNRLMNQAVAYINVDIAVAGRDMLYVGASPQLAAVLRNVAKTIPAQPGVGTVGSGDSLYDTAWPTGAFDELGSGSDFTGFVQIVGVPAIDITLSSLDGGYEGVYHSNYDSFYWMTSFGDPEFRGHAAVAALWGALAIRLADATVLPFNYSEYALEVARLTQTLQQNAAAQGMQLDWSPLTSAIDQLATAAEATQKEVEELSTGSTGGGAGLAERLREINDRLMLIERAFLADVPTHNNTRLVQQYKHAIFAPSPVDSYDHSVFPSLAVAVAETDVTEAQFQIKYLAQLVAGAAGVLQGGWEL